MVEQNTLGVFEKVGKGSGFIRRRQHSYLPSDDDIHVGRQFVEGYRLRTGDEIAGVVGKPPGRGKSAPLKKLTAINGLAPDSLDGRPEFNSLGAIHPDEQLTLDCGLVRRGAPDFTNRVIDLMCPFGKGQRALIVSPAKAGKTSVLQAVADRVQ